MTEAEQIAEFLAKKGATRCPPGWAAPTSNAVAEATLNPPQKKGQWRGGGRHMRSIKKLHSQKWAYTKHSP